MAGLKKCPKCDLEKPLAEFQKNKKRYDGLQSYCRICMNAYHVNRPHRTYSAEYYRRNAEKLREQARAKYWRNPEKIRARQKARMQHPESRAHVLSLQRKYSAIVKDEVFAADGGYVCACCGEKISTFLTIDHIHGCGREQRKEHGLGGSFYSWLRRKGFPPGFQVLCFNCNLGRAKNGGICPHQA